MRTSVLNICALLSCLATTPSKALESLTFTVTDASDEGLKDRLREASILAQAQRDRTDTPQDLLSAALGDYTRLLEVLYAAGYYSGVISIRIDGREAALIPPLETPARVDTITVTVNQGRPFRFGVAEVAPLAPGTRAPRPFRPEQRARATAVTGAVEQATADWRAAGHAKAAPAAQSLTANHATQILNARIAMDPGPLVRFGALRVTPGSSVRDARIRAIAGLPEGEVFAPEALDRAASRLRRTGAFRSVALSEDDRLGPANSMDITATVVDERPRRFGVGAELSSFEGLRLSGFWMHRNLLGGAERFRVESEISDIGGQVGGLDYRLGLRFDRPAVWGPDTSLYLRAEVEHVDDPFYRTDRGELGIGMHRILGPTLTGDLALAFSRERTRDLFGTRDVTLVSLPGALTWDRRDNLLTPRAGHYIRAEATPFAGIQGVSDGARLRLDARAYRALSQNPDIVLAGRLQLGALSGAAIAEAPAGYLFYSGGGGTVRGQPYQSLGVDQGGGGQSGGRGFVGASVELRGRIIGPFSLVGFADAGFISADPGPGSAGDWHVGAGLGLRYNTVVGPIRLDLAGPVSGRTGKGLQVYIGIGQAF